MTAVQALYEICSASFDGQPAPEAVDRVCAALDNITCSDLGLEDEEQHVAAANGRRSRLPNTLARVAPAITYLHLYECEKFSMGIFCLPQSAVIPLHNHPGMTVFSKLLYGSMHVKSYDWIDPLDEKLSSNPSIPRLAKPVKDHVLVAPCQTSVLHPTCGGNIHSFTAVTSCAVLDVLAPPYSNTDGRHIIYYRLSSSTSTELPPSAQQEWPNRRQGSSLKKKSKNKKSAVLLPMEASSSLQENGNVTAAAATGSNSSRVLLEEFQPPKDFVVQPGNYRGPMVIPRTITTRTTSSETTTISSSPAAAAPAPAPAAAAAPALEAS